MEEFCRTCGKTVIAESSVNIFSANKHRLLHSVRTITNCWVENVLGFPMYICEDCQALVKKISAFRKRCSKIEAFLCKRKTKLGSNFNKLNGKTDASKNDDPLEIEEQDGTVTYDIKVEPYNVIEEKVYEVHDEDIIEKASESNYDAQQEEDLYAALLYDEEMQEAPLDTTSVADIIQEEPEEILKSPIKEPPKARSKSASRKYTMRVGKRTMYIRMTDDKQPKRIVDPQRQWSSSRPCICEHCGRQFKDGSNLNVHLLRHAGTKKYECKQCNEKCYTLHLLRRHQLKHTEGPYECTFCGLQYSTNSSRVRHEREACKKGRAPKSKTEVIKRGERTFHCDVCDLWFLRAGNLAQHIVSNNHIANERRKNKKHQLKQKI